MVKAIGHNAFDYCVTLDRITIPESVSFDYCKEHLTEALRQFVEEPSIEIIEGYCCLNDNLTNISLLNSKLLPCNMVISFSLSLSNKS